MILNYNSKINIMNILNQFIGEIRRFVTARWWVVVVYFILLAVILKLNPKSLGPVVLITSLHFTADMLIMTMFSAYASGRMRLGTRLQIGAMLLFTTVKLYTGLTYPDSWVFLTADLAFYLAALKNYLVDIRKVKTGWFDHRLIAVVSLVTLAILGREGLLPTPFLWMIGIGLFSFATSLSITGHEKFRYLTSLLALTLMVAGSAWGLVDALQMSAASHGEVPLVPLSLSYTLLPLVVLITSLENWQTVMGPGSAVERA